MKIQLLVGIIFCLVTSIHGQQVDSLSTKLDRLSSFPNRFFSRIQKKSADLNASLDRQTEKYLEKLARKEKKIQQKLYKTDSNAAKQLFAGTQEKYLAYEQQLKAEASGQSLPLQGEYMANIDSVKTSLAFLQQNQNSLGSSGKSQQALSSAVQQFNLLQSKFQQTDQIKEFIRQRKQQLKDELVSYSQTLGLNKYLAEYNQQEYYYSEQIREYKAMFNDPDKLMKEALVILNKIPAFQTFMKNNSQLAGLFGVSPDYGSSGAVDGLQTRDEVQQLMQQQISSGGAGGVAAMQSNLESAHQELDQFKDKLSSLGAGSGDIDMPNFKPNIQKTRSFLNRLDLGINMQTTKANWYFPSTTDIGLSIGYKIFKGNVIGIGGSYKIGWGTNIREVRLTSQGMSLRSFVDIQVKKSFIISGGFEENLLTPFTSLSQTQVTSLWQKSGLIGVSKLVSLPGKVVKKTKASLLWDFLSSYESPRTEAIKFRIQYGF